MKIFLFSITLAILIIFALAATLAIVSKKSDNRCTWIMFRSGKCIDQDAREYLKQNGYHNTAYNQQMLKGFAKHRITKHASDV